MLAICWTAYPEAFASIFSTSILTPFALGAVIGGIASGRAPVDNAEGIT